MKMVCSQVRVSVHFPRLARIPVRLHRVAPLSPLSIHNVGVVSGHRSATSECGHVQHDTRGGGAARTAVSPDVEQMTPRVDARAPYADRLAPSGAAVSSAQTARSMHVDAVECTPNCRKTEQSEAAQDTKRTPWEWGRHQNAHTRTNHPWRHVVRACGHECTGK